MLQQILAISFLFIFLAASVQAGKYNPVLSIGDKAPSWSDLPGVDGKPHSLSDYADAKLLVVAFTCNTCPYATDYEERLNQLHADSLKSSGEFAVVAINSNSARGDDLKSMQQRKLRFHYLKDEQGTVAKDYGAIRTPEFLLLDQDRKVIYMGAFDDNTNPEKAKTHYLRAAINATLAGEDLNVTETIAIGCNIRFARQRRTREKKE